MPGDQLPTPSSGLSHSRSKMSNKQAKNYFKKTKRTINSVNGVMLGKSNGILKYEVSLFLI